MHGLAIWIPPQIKIFMISLAVGYTLYRIAAEMYVWDRVARWSYLEPISVSGTTVIWPLFVTMTSDFATKPQREFLWKKLEYIATAMGISQARVLLGVTVRPLTPTYINYSNVSTGSYIPSFGLHPARPCECSVPRHPHLTVRPNSSLLGPCLIGGIDIPECCRHCSRWARVVYNSSLIDLFQAASCRSQFLQVVCLNFVVLPTARPEKAVGYVDVNLPSYLLARACGALYIEKCYNDEHPPHGGH
jgi:hypothetical protein